MSIGRVFTGLQAGRRGGARPARRVRSPASAAQGPDSSIPVPPTRIRDFRLQTADVCNINMVHHGGLQKPERARGLTGPVKRVRLGRNTDQLGDGTVLAWGTLT